MSPVGGASGGISYFLSRIRFHLMGEKQHRVPRWYFGGLTGSIVTCLGHPLELIKVQLQTQSGKEKVSIAQLTSNVIKNKGVLGLYSGISAALLRQMTYTTTKFAIYELAKQSRKDHTLVDRIIMAGTAGYVGGFIGTPADMINVRMQNDVKLPPEKRRNYKNALDGLIKVAVNESPLELFEGASMASVRAAVMTIGQLSLYDEAKMVLLRSGMFEDNIHTHFTCSSIAGAVSTFLTQPLDVLKTRMMSAKPGKYKSVLDCIKVTAMGGPLAFFKGFVPALLRIVPMTIMAFTIYEQLRQNFGIVPQKKIE